MKPEPRSTSLPHYTCILIGVINKQQDDGLSKEYLEELLLWPKHTAW